MKLLKVILFLGVLWMFLTGASCPPRDTPVKRESPEKNLRIFREALEKGDYETAYFSLSKTTRQRYAYNHFKMMLEWTIFGVLIKSILINWDITSVEYFKETIKPVGVDDKTPRIIEKAKVLLRHWKYHNYQKEFIFIYEDNGWRIDFTLSGIIGIPQEDEDTLFPIPPKDDKQK
jgi:hypothetical protein